MILKFSKHCDILTLVKNMLGDIQMGRKSKYNDFLKIGDKIKCFEIIGNSFQEGGVWRILCKCQCGTIKNMTISSIVKGSTKSCGCELVNYRTNQSGAKQLNIGDSFGRLEVTDQAYQLESIWFVPVVCDCGTSKNIRYSYLISKQQPTKSCGCLNTEIIAKIFTTHGESKTKLFKRWLYMINRCYVKSDGNYYMYGARGITVEEPWRNDFLSFKEWALNNGYRDDLVLDRIDTYGPYAPWNCRYVTQKKNSNNAKTNVRIAAYGEEKTASEWAEDSRCKISAVVLRKRLKRKKYENYSMEDIMNIVYK